MLLEIMHPRVIGRGSDWYSLYWCFYHFPSWWIVKEHCKCIRHWGYSKISLMMESFRYPVTWRSRYRNSDLCWVSWKCGIWFFSGISFFIQRFFMGLWWSVRV